MIKICAYFPGETAQDPGVVEIVSDHYAPTEPGLYSELYTMMDAFPEAIYFWAEVVFQAVELVWGEDSK